MTTLQKKYELVPTQAIIEPGGHVLCRIRALRDIGDKVRAGDLGGYIEHEFNLAQYGECWIHGDARVTQLARVFGNAQIQDNAWVMGQAQIHGNAIIGENVCISGEAEIFDNAQVWGDAPVSGKAQIFNDAYVFGSQEMKIDDHAKIYECARIKGAVKIYGNAEVYGQAYVGDYARAYGNAKIYDIAKMFDHTIVRGSAHLHEGAQMRDKAVISDNADVGGEALLSGNAHVRNDDVLRWEAIAYSKKCVTSVVDGNKKQFLTLCRAANGDDVIVTPPTGLWCRTGDEFLEHVREQCGEDSSEYKTFLEVVEKTRAIIYQDKGLDQQQDIFRFSHARPHG